MLDKLTVCLDKFYDLIKDRNERDKKGNMIYVSMILVYLRKLLDINLSV